MKMIVSSIIMLISSLLVSANGFWNGKPWDPVKLREGVEAEKADALGEWAYCSALAACGIARGSDVFEERLEIAVKAKKPVALYLHCLLNLNKKLEAEKQKAFDGYMANLKQLKHPLWFDLEGHLLRYGLHGYEKDVHAAIQSFEKAIKAGCVCSRQPMGEIHLRGPHGEVDTEAAAENFRISLKNGYPMGAYAVASAYVESYRYRDLRQFFSEEEFETAKTLIDQTSYLKHDAAIRLIGRIYLYDGRPHEAVPLLLNCANRSEKETHHTLLCANRHFPYTYANHGIQPIVTDYVARQKGAAKDHERGTMSKGMEVEYATSLLYRKERPNERPEQEELGISLLVNQIKGSSTGLHRTSYTLGNYLSRASCFRGYGGEAYLKRGLAHLELHSDAPDSLYIASYCYGDRSSRGRNLPKAIAMIKEALRISGEGGRTDALLKLQKTVLADATAKDHAEAKKLIDDDWPGARKHRAKAFAYLQEIGDIAKEREYHIKPAQKEGL